MATKYKLAIGDVLVVPVKGTIEGDRGPVNFDFRLRMRRLDGDQYNATFGDESQVKVRDFLAENTLGWSGQDLVLDEDGAPAEFSGDAMQAMLSIVAMPMRISQAYIAAYAISDKPAGRRGNS